MGTWCIWCFGDGSWCNWCFCDWCICSSNISEFGGFKMVGRLLVFVKISMSGPIRKFFCAESCFSISPPPISKFPNWATWTSFCRMKSFLKMFDASGANSEIFFGFSNFSDRIFGFFGFSNENYEVSEEYAICSERCNIKGLRCFCQQVAKSSLW